MISMRVLLVSLQLAQARIPTRAGAMLNMRPLGVHLDGRLQGAGYHSSTKRGMKDLSWWTQTAGTISDESTHGGRTSANRRHMSATHDSFDGLIFCLLLVSFATCLWVLSAWPETRSRNVVLFDGEPNAVLLT